MSDFASAAMVGVMLKGMARLGLDTGPVQHLAQTEGAHIPLQSKQALATAAWAQGGWASLLHLGQGFHDMADAPLHRALASAPDAAILLARWCRLEKYVHSRHRVLCLQVVPTQATLQHISLVPRTPPAAAEDLVVLGLLCALLQALGLRQVSAQLQGVDVFPQADAQALHTLATQGRTAHWTLHWAEDLPSTLAPPSSISLPPAQAPHKLCASMDWPDLAQQCAATMLGDLMYPHTVASVAQQMGLSARSLQRQLQHHGLRFSQVAAEVRLRAAAWWLLESRLSLAEIGFVCGYADQAHFNRSYKRHTGLAPGAYRTSFGGASAVLTP